ncbi:MAG: hypothetical protein ABI548_04655 [Polyangiaceae bacterium]
MAKENIELHLTGPQKGPPSADDILQLYRNLTGREPTVAEATEVRAMIAEQLAQDAATNGDP